MSLKKKITLSFFISAFIIAILTGFEYVNFIELRREIRYLELTDTVSHKSVELRRYEKNYFLYGPNRDNVEAAVVYYYLGQLKDVLAKNPHFGQADQRSLHNAIDEYEQQFKKIDAVAKNLKTAFEKIKTSNSEHDKIIALIEDTFLERPAQSAAFLTGVLQLPERHPLVSGLNALNADITALRKTGEDILAITKNLDEVVREKAVTVIHVSQIAILVFFPLFFVVGIGMLFFISTNVVRRLVLLISVVERTGKGSYPHLSESGSKGNPDDEVGVLIDKFNDMEDQLALREQELDRKNAELMQAKKLAAIGTLASGVAHELNNPLNNIYLAAQVLALEAGGACSLEVNDAVRDIVSQTERVKRIVSDLLEFARGRELRFQEMDLIDLISDAYRHVASSRDLKGIRFSFAEGPSSLVLSADAGQLDQVFTNLFINAVDAMEAKGDLIVSVRQGTGRVSIGISDTGKGISAESLDKIFEPFFSTKEKGTGLGLAIVYNIVKKHHGDITVRSEEGRGTTFTLTLPTHAEPGM
jgi:two-component system, NtrC family, sensor kinase